MINEGIQLIHAYPLPLEIRQRQMRLVESGRMKVSETPGTYALLATEERSAALAARRNGDKEYLRHHAQRYLKYTRLMRNAIRRLYEEG